MQLSRTCYKYQRLSCRLSLQICTQVIYLSAGKRQESVVFTNAARFLAAFRMPDRAGL